VGFSLTRQRNERKRHVGQVEIYRCGLFWHIFWLTKTSDICGQVLLDFCKRFLTWQSKRKNNLRFIANVDGDLG